MNIENNIFLISLLIIQINIFSAEKTNQKKTNKI